MLVNDTILNNTGSIGFAKDYAENVVGLALSGDMFAIIIALLFSFVALFIINKLSSIILVIIKKTIVFVITALGVLFFSRTLLEKVAVEGLTISTIFMGVLGAIFGLVGFAVAFYALFKHSKKKIKEMRSGDTESFAEEKPQPAHLDSVKDITNMFSVASIKNDKSLLSVLAFLVVAEFGVFSSKTIAAPNTQIGLIAFGLFMAVSLIFIKQSYAHYGKGLLHLTITFVIGATLSIILGTYWGGYPLGTLLSLGYFSSDALVALISGMALSLFAGSKG